MSSAMSLFRRPFSLRARGFLFCLALAPFLPAAAADAPAPDVLAQRAGGAPALDLTEAPGLDQVLASLGDRRVIYVGETHDRYEHHMVQLQVIRRLHASNPKLAIGVEFFQQPFQKYLDDYVAKRIDTRELLIGTEYFERWRIDFRHYAPILAYARDNAIPVLALNVPRELVRKVSQGGMAGLTEKERAGLPAVIDDSDTAYRERLRKVFDQHPKEDGTRFEYFVEAQLLWDEGMAERAATYLEQHPDYTLIVLAGSGHLVFGYGIPKRLQRRIEVPGAVIVNANDRPIEPGMADFVVIPEKAALPPAGRIGVMLEEGERTVRISEVLPDGAAAGAGLKPGDRIVGLDGFPVRRHSDLKAVLWDKRPGDSVSLKVMRRTWPLPGKTLKFDLTLGP